MQLGARGTIPEGLIMAQEHSNDGGELGHRGDTASRVCLRKDMRPVPCMDILGE